MSAGLHPGVSQIHLPLGELLSVCISRVRIHPSTNCRIRQPIRKMKRIVSELSDKLENRDLALTSSFCLRLSLGPCISRS